MPVAAVGAAGPAGQRVAVHLRDRLRAGVVERDAGVGQVGAAAHTVTRLDGAAQLRQERGERVGDGGRAALGDRPPVHVSCGGEHHAHRRGGRPVERAVDVRRRAAEEGPGLRGPEPRGEHGGRQPGPEPEPRHPQGVAGPAQHRPEHVAGKLVEATDQRAEDTSPGLPVRSQPRAGLVERADQDPRRTVVQGVREVDLGVPPDEAVLGQRERGQERRRDGERVHGGADVVQEAGQGQLRGAGAAADRVLALEHRDRPARLRERDRGGQPVGTGADDDRVEAHAVAGADEVTYTGTSWSVGCRSTRFLTSTYPRSSSPVAASTSR